MSQRMARMQAVGYRFLIVLLLVLAACGKSEETSSPPRQAAERQQAELRQLSRQFQGLQRKIGRLQGAADRLPPAARARMAKPMAALLQQQDAVAQKLTDAGEAADEQARARLLPRAQEAVRGLQKSYDRTRKAVTPLLARE